MFIYIPHVIVEINFQMTPLIKNTIIGEYLENTFYTTSKDHHKVILLWASKFHRHFNRILRDYTLDDVLQNATWTKKYLKDLMKYFKKYGKTKEHLVKHGITELYRGYSAGTLLVHGASFQDDGFIATSTKKHIAETFARDDGILAVVHVKDLPPNAIYVKIDESISQDMLEEEILLIPGTLSFKRIDDVFRMFYSPDVRYLSMIENMSGGDKNMSNTTKVQIPKSSLFPVNNKLFVWWRSIVERPVESLGWIITPKDPKEAIKYFKTHIIRHDDSFQYKNKYIPDYSDLCQKRWSERTDEENHRFHSYIVHMAMIDLASKDIIDLRYGIPPNMIGELMPSDKNDEIIGQYLLKTHEWLF